MRTFIQANFYRIHHLRETQRRNVGYLTNPSTRRGNDLMNRDSSSSPTGRFSVLEVLRSDLAPGLLVLAAMLLFAPRLEVPPKYMFDEVYHAYTAGQYAAGNADAYTWDTEAPTDGVAYTWNHPPLGMLMMAGGILLWGDEPFGWRFSSAAPL